MPTKSILLTQGKVTLVDEEDFEYLSQWSWCVRRVGRKRDRFYAGRREGSQIILMHRQILGLEAGDKRQADHINHLTLDNHRCNLRICTNQENSFYQLPRGGTSEFKGVCWAKGKLYKGRRYNNSGRWVSSIMYNYHKYYLGVFKSEIEAALAYDVAAKKYFGNEYSILNFPRKDSENGYEIYTD